MFALANYLPTPIMWPTGNSTVSRYEKLGRCQGDKMNPQIHPLTANC